MKLPHFGMQFGAVAANHGWHRIGSFIAWIVRVHFRAPLGRYVDDFFGATAPGIKWTAGILVTKLAAMMDFPCDPSKDRDDGADMVVLGAEVSYCLHSAAVFTIIAKEKAIKWASSLEKSLAEGCLISAMASKAAGRLQAAVSMSLCKVGRAFVKPFYMQIYDPRPCITPLLANAMCWWMDYLRLRPSSKSLLHCVQQHTLIGQTRLVFHVC